MCSRLRLSPWVDPHGRRRAPGSRAAWVCVPPRPQVTDRRGQAAACPNVFRGRVQPGSHDRQGRERGPHRAAQPRERPGTCLAP